MAFLVAASLSASPIVEVDTPSLGPVIGRRTSNIDAFLNIRYALPPERFEPPEAYIREDRRNPYNATALGDWCIQASGAEKLDPNNTYSEDCLSLNLWRRAGSNLSAPSSVLLFVHVSTAGL